LDAFEAAEIKEAFGHDEAMKMINAPISARGAAVRAHARQLEMLAAQGRDFTEQMARAALDNNWDATMVLNGPRVNGLQQMDW